MRGSPNESMPPDDPPVVAMSNGYAHPEAGFGPRLSESFRSCHRFSAVVLPVATRSKQNPDCLRQICVGCAEPLANSYVKVRQFQSRIFLHSPKAEY